MTIAELKAEIADCADDMEVYFQRYDDDYPVSAIYVETQQYGFGGQFTTILVINN